MPLKRNRDGSISIRSKSHVLAAVERRASIEAELAVLMATPEIMSLREEFDALGKAVDEYVIAKFEAGEGIETENWKITKVVGHKRKWNAAVLEKLVPRAMFKRLIVIQVDPSAIDEMVRAKKLDRKKIAEAFEETANAPYVKITERSQNGSHADEAESLAAKLGV